MISSIKNTPWRGTYDAIVTDPPYSIRTALLVKFDPTKIKIDFNSDTNTNSSTNINNNNLNDDFTKNEAEIINIDTNELILERDKIDYENTNNIQNDEKKLHESKNITLKIDLKLDENSNSNSNSNSNDNTILDLDLDLNLNSNLGSNLDLGDIEAIVAENEILFDLISFASSHLRPYGRLVFWWPDGTYVFHY